MTLLITIAFVLSVTGCFIMLDLSPFHFLEELGKAIKPPKTTIKSKIESTKKKQKTKGIKLFFLEIKEILRLTGKQNTFNTLCVLAMILFVLGAMIAISMDNTYLIPVMAVGFSLLPFYYVKFTANKHRKALNTELETTLSVITTSYMRNNNTFINAVEENLNYLNPPMYDMFADFLVHAKLFDTSLREALQKLKLGFNNAVFEEWVDTVMDCQEDHNLKNTLPVIVSKLSDMRIVSVELEIGRASCRERV